MPMNKRLIRVIKNPVLVVLALLDRLAFIFPDKLFLKIKYYLIINKPLNLENPTTFNEKLQWLKINDRNPKYTQMVDKIDAKIFVTSIIEEKYIIPTLGVFEKFEDIDFDLLPNQFVIKCTHDSGGVVICKDKSTFNYPSAKSKIEKHAKSNPYYFTREWPYKNIKPRILVEQYLIDSNNEDLVDYKFMVFNGFVRCLFVVSQRNTATGLKVDFFDENWKHLPFERYYKNSEKPIRKPSLFSEMKQLAETLAQQIKSSFVRIDFYQANNHIYFGEITFYPGGGWEPFTPVEWDYQLGSWIVL